MSIRKRGSRQEVLNGSAQLTSGGLSIDDLVYNEKTGKICTKKEIQRGVELSAKMKKKTEPVSEVVAAEPGFVVEIEPMKKARKTRAKKIKAEVVAAEE